MFHRCFIYFLIAFSSACFAQPKENRVALVVGNSAYKTAPLRNPTNDAKDMATKLKGLGFTVIERSNLSVKQIGSTLREFRAKLTPGSVALVFYAGHGVQIKGENYLPAVDADIAGEEDVPTQSLAMRQIMDVLADAKTRLNLVFLDACRNNPYARSFRSAGDGLSRVNAPSGTLISFATRPGSVASDGQGRNGLYTSALLEQMSNQSQPIEQVLKRVVSQVKAGSNSQQEPWMEGSIEGDFCFGTCGMQQVQKNQLNENSNFLSILQSEEKFWEDVKLAGNKEAFEAYVKLYQKGRFIHLAKASILKIESTHQKTDKNTENSDALMPDLFDKLKIFLLSKRSLINCNSRLSMMSTIKDRTIVTHLKNGEDLISKSHLDLNEIKYYGSNDYDWYTFSAVVSGENIKTNKTQIFYIVFDTNFVKSRVTISIDDDGNEIIKNGLYVSTKQPVPDAIKCD